ncbi:MAG: ComF family protein [Dehalococcoidia bacterium]|nr:ComF family protein [Dehalococcoidia bacterium]
MLCSSCASRESPVSSVRSVFRFEGVARNAIHELKYRNLRAIAPTLAAYLDDYLTRNPVEFDVVVPVPLHSKRLRTRGYNQAELLSRALARRKGIPLNTRSLHRTGGGTSQVRSTSAGERRHNVSDAFTCIDESLSGKRILLIDDVCTTGATLEACAATLRSTGVREVYGLTVAREV